MQLQKTLKSKHPKLYKFGYLSYLWIIAIFPIKKENQFEDIEPLQSWTNRRNIVEIDNINSTHSYAPWYSWGVYQKAWTVKAEAISPNIRLPKIQ